MPRNPLEKALLECALLADKQGQKAMAVILYSALGAMGDPKEESTMSTMCAALSKARLYDAEQRQRIQQKTKPRKQ